jgi:histone-lysine N-methyltransferase SETMAR
MTRERDFIADILRAEKSVKEAKKMADDVYGENSLKVRPFTTGVLKLVIAGKNTDDKRRFNAKKTTRTDHLVTAVAAAIEDDRRVHVQAFAKAFNVSAGTIFNIIQDDLGLVKKSARWFPKLLSSDQMEKRVETSAAFVQQVQEKGQGILSRIVTMGKNAVSMHTPETKHQSMQWLKKGAPGPVKAKVIATHAKQMVLAFFDDQGIVYTNYVPRGVTVNAAYIVNALRRFLKAFRKKRPDLVAGEWFLHWNNVPVHTAEVVQTFLAKNSIRLIPHPPYSPDLTPTDIFLFPTLKKELSGLTLTFT